MMTTATAGTPVTLRLNFYDEASGALADAAAVQLDVTYGQEIGFAADAAGPFTYSGASAPTPGQVWRTGSGQYACTWNVPLSALPGVYIANWSVGFGGDTFLAFENFPVAGGGSGIPVPAGDLGYWTGSITNPATGLAIEFGAADADGIAWLWQRLDGWDSPDVQGAGVIPKSGDHGGWATPQFYAPRALTWTVTASAPSQALRDQARALLQQAVPVSDLATLIYDEPVPKQVQVRRSGRITEQCPTLADVTFTIGLIAPDPRKYSTQQRTASVNASPTSLTGVAVPFTVPVLLPAQQPGGTVACLNAGTFESRPVVTVAGPITSPAVTNITLGQTVSWTGLVLGAGDELVIDFGVQQAALNGAYRPADLFSGWWTLPPAAELAAPGTSTIALSGDSSAGAGMSIAWRDAFI